MANENRSSNPMCKCGHARIWHIGPVGEGMGSGPACHCGCGYFDPRSSDVQTAVDSNCIASEGYTDPRSNEAIPTFQGTILSQCESSGHKVDTGINPPYCHTCALATATVKRCREVHPGEGGRCIYGEGHPIEYHCEGSLKWPVTRSQEARVGGTEHVAFWEAIHAYVIACGGETELANSAKMSAVVAVEKAAAAWAHPAHAPCSDKVTPSKDWADGVDAAAGVVRAEMSRHSNAGVFALLSKLVTTLETLAENHPDRATRLPHANIGAGGGDDDDVGAAWDEAIARCIAACEKVRDNHKAPSEDNLRKTLEAIASGDMWNAREAACFALGLPSPGEAPEQYKPAPVLDYPKNSAERPVKVGDRVAWDIGTVLEIFDNGRVLVVWDETKERSTEDRLWHVTAAAPRTDSVTTPERK